MELFHELVYDGINVDVIHAERSAAQRDATVDKFRSGKVQPLPQTTAQQSGPPHSSQSLPTINLMYHHQPQPPLTSIPTPALHIIASPTLAASTAAVCNRDRNRHSSPEHARADLADVYLKVWVLIATELMARGMDFKGVSLVINFDFPQARSNFPRTAPPLPSSPGQPSPTFPHAFRRRFHTSTALGARAEQEGLAAPSPSSRKRMWSNFVRSLT